MKMKLIPLAGLLATVLLVACKTESTTSHDADGAIPTTPPDPPSAEVVAALEAQPVGKKFLGKTMLLVGEELVKSDFQSAPEYYLVHYSASW